LFFVSEGAMKKTVSRRSFLKTGAAGAVAAGVAPGVVLGAAAAGSMAEGGTPPPVLGPGPVAFSLTVNGVRRDLKVEPRVTLLEALRDHLDLTGAKKVCDRGTCGACTVLLDGEPVYSCMMLAIQAQGREITTVEGLARNGNLTPLQEAFVDKDASMCGYCTPGFVMSLTALLRKNPQPSPADIRHACAGNLCRCGTQPRIVQAALQASGVEVLSRTEVISYANLA